MDIEALADRFGAHHTEVKDLLTGVKDKQEEIDCRLRDIEQKSVRHPGTGGGDGLSGGRGGSWGAQFTASPELKAFAEERSRPTRLKLEMKTTITTDAGSGGDLGTPYRDGLAQLPRRVPRVRDLLPVVRVTGGSVEYPRQTTRTNAAAPVAEAALKPESAYGFELVTTPLRVIAHWVPASRQILDDAPQLMGLIDSELRYGLALKEDDQLLTGDGTGQNLNGLIPQATAYSAPFDPGGTESMVDIVALGILQTALADLPADGVVMHPSDWMRIRLLKDGDGKYILGDPGANVEPRLFGLPVVETTAMTVDKFLVGSFRAAATLYDRWDARVEVSTEHSDFFTRNLVAVLAEERIGLAVKRPLALVFGDFGNIA